MEGKCSCAGNVPSFSLMGKKASDALSVLYPVNRVNVLLKTKASEFLGANGSVSIDTLSSEKTKSQIDFCHDDKKFIKSGARVSGNGDLHCSVSMHHQKLPGLSVELSSLLQHAQDIRTPAIKFQYAKDLCRTELAVSKVFGSDKSQQGCTYDSEVVCGTNGFFVGSKATFYQNKGIIPAVSQFGVMYETNEYELSALLKDFSLFSVSALLKKSEDLSVALTAQYNCDKKTGDLSLGTVSKVNNQVTIGAKVNSALKASVGIKQSLSNSVNVNYCFEFDVKNPSAPDPRMGFSLELLP